MKSIPSRWGNKDESAGAEYQLLTDNCDTLH
jgi:hypothetical protein